MQEEEVRKLEGDSWQAWVVLNCRWQAIQVIMDALSTCGYRQKTLLGPSWQNWHVVWRKQVLNPEGVPVRTSSLEEEFLAFIRRGRLE